MTVRVCHFCSNFQCLNSYYSFLGTRNKNVLLSLADPQINFMCILIISMSFTYLFLLIQSLGSHRCKFKGLKSLLLAL